MITDIRDKYMLINKMRNDDDQLFQVFKVKQIGLSSDHKQDGKEKENGNGSDIKYIVRHLIIDNRTISFCQYKDDKLKILNEISISSKLVELFRTTETEDQ